MDVSEYVCVFRVAYISLCMKVCIYAHVCKHNTGVFICVSMFWASQVALVVKNTPGNAGEVRDVGSIPGLRRSFGGGHGNPLQYSCLENPMDRGARWATVHRVTKSWTRLK